MVERRNIINNYIRGRACIESVRGSVESSDFSFFFALFLGLPLSVPFLSVEVFPSST
jgi:hypothetical protein